MHSLDCRANHCRQPTPQSGATTEPPCFSFCLKFCQTIINKLKTSDAPATGPSSTRPRTWRCRCSLRPAFLAEHFRFKSEAESRDYLRAAKSRQAVADELSDCLYWLLLLAMDARIDVAQAFARKMRQNARQDCGAQGQGEEYEVGF